MWIRAGGGGRGQPMWIIFKYYNIIIKSDKVVKLVRGGSVINGAYPVKFLTLSTNKYMQGAQVISTLSLFQNCFSFRDRTIFSHGDFNGKWA